MKSVILHQLPGIYAPHPQKKCIYFDISKLHVFDYKTGIQRVLRSLLAELLKSTATFEYCIIPVGATFLKKGYFEIDVEDINGVLNFRSTRRFITPREGDIFLSFEFDINVQFYQKDVLFGYKQNGCKVVLALYDLFPINIPQYVTPKLTKDFERWINASREYTSLYICDSQAVKNELTTLFQERNWLPVPTTWIHLGCNFIKKISSSGISEINQHLLAELKTNNSLSFLMVGTIEPRKQHQFVLETFEQLWKDGKNYKLLFVGKPGWLVNDLIKKINTHPELNRRLFYISNATDEEVRAFYETCSCMIFASSNEGFGLPLIEAAQHNCPIIARDIPIFHEIGGNNVFYFKSQDADGLYSAIITWEKLYMAGSAPQSKAMPFLTWTQSCEQLLNRLGI